MKQHVICLVDADEKAQELIQKLIRCGVSQSKIIVLASRPDDEGVVAPRNSEKAEKHVSGGQQVGPTDGIGPALIEGLNQFMPAGDIAQGIGSSAKVDAANEEAFKLLSRFGLTEEAAREYKDKLAEGGILLAVQADRDFGHSVRNIFEAAHCQQIAEV
jgi:Heat induced stress protein YflT